MGAVGFVLSVENADVLCVSSFEKDEHLKHIKHIRSVVVGVAHHFFLNHPPHRSIY